MSRMAERPGDFEVVTWPSNADARRSLESYLAKLKVYLVKLTREALSSEPMPVLEGSGLDFRGADLSRLVLTEADLVGANLTGVRLDEAALQGAWLHDLDAQGCRLRRASLNQAQFRNGQLSGADFVGARLEDAEFYDTILIGADFSDTDVGDVWMQGADLRNANFRGCNMGSASSGMALRDSRLGGAIVENSRGLVAGPIDVGVDVKDVRDGPALTHWFSQNGASDIRVVTGT